LGHQKNLRHVKYVTRISPTRPSNTNFCLQLVVTMQHNSNNEIQFKLLLRKPACLYSQMDPSRHDNQNELLKWTVIFSFCFPIDDNFGRRLNNLNKLGQARPTRVSRLSTGEHQDCNVMQDVNMKEGTAASNTKFETLLCSSTLVVSLASYFCSISIPGTLTTC